MDQKRADALIGEIGEVILRDPTLTDDDWDSVAFVAVLEKPVSVFGFRYSADKHSPTTPLTIELLALLEELQKATSDKRHPPWKACLIQVNEADLDFQIDFVYDDPSKWRLTPENYKTLPL